jgi:hypothetical protein
MGEIETHAFITRAYDGSTKFTSGGSTKSTVMKFDLRGDSEGEGPEGAEDEFEYQCSLDHQPFSECPGGVPGHAHYNQLIPGTHTLEVMTLIKRHGNVIIPGKANKSEPFTWTVTG